MDTEADIFEPFEQYGKRPTRHSKEFRAILEQASPAVAIRAITHARQLLVF